MILNVIRTNKFNDPLGDPIKTIFDKSEICEDLCHGISGRSAESTVDAYELVQNAFQKSIKNLVLVHQLQLDPGESLEDAKVVTDGLKDYQMLAGVNGDEAHGYQVTIAINPVSYKNGNCLHDNNATYERILSDLRQNGCRIGVGNDVLFDNGDLKKSYKQ